MNAPYLKHPTRGSTRSGVGNSVTIRLPSGWPAVVGSLIIGCMTTLGVWAFDRPNIILVMADDMGWGQTGYRGHPLLKTPHLNAMAAGGLRFDRFYAASPVCSPTRASVLTGRTAVRTGVLTHGYGLRRQEETIATILRRGGYATGHFGKWHLNAVRGPGVPIPADDPHGPGAFGFDHWVSVTNYFDRDPLMSHNGRVEQHAGDSSEIVVAETLNFVRRQHDAGKPFFAVAWFGTPHSPFVATAEDTAAFQHLDTKSRNHHGELVAMDRAIGTLRRELREINAADNTLLWFTSDNGGLPEIRPDTTGGLRGFKGSVYEGGLRVPAVVEWPSRVAAGSVCDEPTVSMDIFPTLIELAGEGVPPGDRPAARGDLPRDGESLGGLFRGAAFRRIRPIGFRYRDRGAWIDGSRKLVAKSVAERQYEMYDLAADPAEQMDLAANLQRSFDGSAISDDVAASLVVAIEEFETWNASVDRSFRGVDYPAGKLTTPDPKPELWTKIPAYKTYISQWRTRPEYRSWIERNTRSGSSEIRSPKERNPRPVRASESGKK